jgi:hypothetical protein
LHRLFDCGEGLARLGNDRRPSCVCDAASSTTVTTLPVSVWLSPTSTEILPAAST